MGSHCLNNSKERMKKTLTACTFKAMQLQLANPKSENKHPKPSVPQACRKPILRMQQEKSYLLLRYPCRVKNSIWKKFDRAGYKQKTCILQSNNQNAVCLN